MAFDYAYGKTTLGDLELHGVHKDDTAEFVLTGVTIEGQLVIPTRGFVQSLCSRFSISRHLQSKRTSGELLSLIVRSFPLAEIAYRIAWDETGTTWLFECKDQQEPTQVLETPAPSDIPSPTSRLEEYGFHRPSAAPESASSESSESQEAVNSHDWPLFRDIDVDCQVPAPQGSGGAISGRQREGLFANGPIGTPRPSVN
jgi:hypothetical protein